MYKSNFLLKVYKSAPLLLFVKQQMLYENNHVENSVLVFIIHRFLEMRSSNNVLFRLRNRKTKPNDALDPVINPLN